MFYIVLLLLLLIGITFTLLGLPGQSDERKFASHHLDVSDGSPQIFGV